MMKETPLQSLIKELERLQSSLSDNAAYSEMEAAIYEAKKRLNYEKEVINEAHSVGWDEGHMYNINGPVHQDYYDETFGIKRD